MQQSASQEVQKEHLKHPTNTKFVGTLNGTMRIYVNQYAADDTVLVGYKGATETDAPGVPLSYIQ